MSFLILTFSTWCENCQSTAVLVSRLLNLLTAMWVHLVSVVCLLAGLTCQAGEVAEDFEPHRRLKRCKNVLCPRQIWHKDVSAALMIGMLFLRCVCFLSFH